MAPHLPKIQGGLFATSVWIDDELGGVAIAANPAQVWQGTGRITIARVAARGVLEDPRNKNACSMLYGAICRAAEALGYAEAWTYTLPEETGESLRGAGFEDMGVSAGGEHDRPSRSREPAVRSEPKQRWRRKLGKNRLRERIVAPRVESAQRDLFEASSAERY